MLTSPDGLRVTTAATLLLITLAASWLLPGGISTALAQRAWELRQINTIVIDPGHGGNNDGARGKRDSQEKDLTLAVAYAVRDELRRRFPNLKVVLTRNIDVDLSLPQRIHTAHMANADLFLSLHMNSSTNPQAAGIEVFYLNTDKSMPLVTYGEGTWGQAFADPRESDVAPDAPIYAPRDDSVQAILSDLDLARSHRDSAVLARTTLEELRRACPKCRNRGVRQANFGVLRGSRVPSIVIEFGFLSHHVEEQRLTSRRAHARFAEALSHVVRRMDQHFTETH